MRLLLSFVLVNPVWTWLQRLGGPGLIALGLADNSAIPLPGSMDLLVILLSAQQPLWWPYYAFMATVGALIGGYLTYRLAEKGGEDVLERESASEEPIRYIADSRRTASPPLQWRNPPDRLFPSSLSC